MCHQGFVPLQAGRACTIAAPARIDYPGDVLLVICNTAEDILATRGIHVTIEPPTNGGARVFKIVADEQGAIDPRLVSRAIDQAIPRIRADLPWVIA